jgi:hypothetical protein
VKDGGDLTIGSGGTLTVESTGELVIGAAGVLIVENTGAIQVDAGGGITVLGTLAIAGTGSFVTGGSSTCTLAGTITVSAADGTVQLLGRTVYPPTVTKTDANTTLDTTMGQTFRFPDPAATRTITLQESSAPIPINGERIRIIVANGGGVFGYNVIREGSVFAIASLGSTATIPAIAEFQYESSTGWRLHSPSTTEVVPGADA